MCRSYGIDSTTFLVKLDLAARTTLEDVERLASLALEIEPHCHQARLLRAEAWAETDFKDRARRELMELDIMVASKYDPVLTSGYDRAVLAFNQERRDSLRRALLKIDGP